MFKKQITNMKSIFSILFFIIIYPNIFSQSIKKVNNQLKIELAQKTILFDSLNKIMVTNQQKYDLFCNDLVDQHKIALIESKINRMLFEFILNNTKTLYNRFDIEFDNSISLKKVADIQSLYTDNKVKIVDSLFRKKYNQIDTPFYTSNDDKLKAKIENKILLKKTHEYDSLIILQKNEINYLEIGKIKLQEHFSFFKNMYLDYYNLNTFLKEQIDRSAIIGFEASEEKKNEIAERIKQIKENNKKTNSSNDKFDKFLEPIDVDYDFTNELVTTSNKTYVSAMNSIINNFKLYYDDPRIETNSEAKYETEYEENPQFPGGEKELMKFIYCNLNLDSLKIEDSKAVIMSFIIDNNGQVLDIKVNRGISETLDNEAIRIVSLMPNWIPGKKNGKPVKSSYNLPIFFNKEKKEGNCQ
jgi:hypothetical protein